MELVLPNKTNSQEAISIESNSIVIIGANGSGKTRFGRDIEQRYDAQTHRVSARKSLSMPKEVSPKSRARAEAEFLYGYSDENNPNNNLRYKIGNRWGQNPNTFLLNDYEKLMVLLHTEEYEESISFKENYIPGQEHEKPFTKLDQVKNIWEHVLPHRKLVIKAGSIETYPIENAGGRYNSSEMSDGERVVFYLIGEVVSVKENSIVVIDEPEMHIHKAITKKLWDKIEQERPDCTFIYLTHDVDFASSRIGATKIWAKSFDGACWDYEILDGDQELPEQLYLEILGSRKPILFIEGDDSSIDHRILQLVFSDHTTKPVGSCDKVFLDSSVFIGKNYNYVHPSFVALKEAVLDERANLLVTDVTIEEIKANIYEDVGKASQALKKIRATAKVLRNVPSLNGTVVFEDIDQASVGTQLVEQLEQFLKDTKADILPVAEADTRFVFDCYFKKSPPFGDGKKKSEFPDAFVLSMLSEWAESMQEDVIVKSRFRHA